MKNRIEMPWEDYEDQGGYDNEKELVEHCSPKKSGLGERIHDAGFIFLLNLDPHQERNAV